VVLAQLQKKRRSGNFLLLFCRLRYTFVGFITFALQGRDSPNVCVLSVSLRGSCACLLSTWQHWISIGPLSTICSFMVHLGFAQSKGIYLGIEGHSPLLYVPITNRLFDHSYSKAEGFLFLFLTGTLHSIG